MKLHYLKTFLFSIVLCACIHSYALDPRLNYEKISTDHFDIIYDAKSYELAKIYLAEAERAHQILTDIFGIAPEKTVVVLDDSYDIANGSATGVPRPAVNVFINPPTSLASIDHFSFWPRDVFLHEYAHILNLEPTRGVWKGFRFVFGSLIKPNMFLPRWYLEGLAVEMESRFNEFGRLKSPDYDAMIRSLYLDNKWGSDNLSAINESSTPYWPAGQRPYFYGSLIWHELIQAKSLSIVKTFNNSYARRFPWFITEPMVREMGVSYEVFLDQVYSKYKVIADTQIKKIQEQEVTQGSPILTKESLFNHSPELSPDGEKLIFVSQNLDGDSLLYVMKRLGENWIPIGALDATDTNVPLQEVEKNETQKASWFPNSQKIVFDAVDIFNHRLFSYDLYTYDLNEKKVKRLTKGLRAREPAVSPKGDSIAFVKAGQGKTSLYSVDSEGKSETLLYAPPGYERVSRPSYINDDELVFSQKDKGVDRLHVLNLKTKQVSRILDYPAKFPVTTTKGIVFSSQKSGVENLYVVSPDFTSVRPLTNSLTRVINGTIDAKNNKIIYSELTGDGPQIKEAMIPKAIPIVPTVTHLIAKDFKEAIVEAPVVSGTQKKYSALPYMFPQFWIPSVMVAEDGTIASVYFPGSDPTGFHSYVFQGIYDSRPEKMSAYFNYLWKTGAGDFLFTAKDYYQWYASLKDATNSEKLSLDYMFALPGWSKSWSFVLGYDYKKISIASTSGFDNFYFSGPAAGVYFNNMDQKAMDISPHGQIAIVKQTKYLSNSTHTDYEETFVKLAHYHSKWLPEHHVLAFSAQGITTHRNRHYLLGTTSTETEFTLGPLGEGFVTRGYPAGEFVGYSVASGMIEYRLPLSQRWSGPNNPSPYFIKRVHGSIFAETLTANGFYFDAQDNGRSTYLGKYFTSAGVDIKVDTTMFYHAPITFKVTSAYGFEKKANGGLNMYFSIMAPELF